MSTNRKGKIMAIPVQTCTFVNLSDFGFPVYWLQTLSSSGDITWGDCEHSLVPLSQIVSILVDDDIPLEEITKYAKDVPSNVTLVDLES